jgi:hypothetical protein
MGKECEETLGKYHQPFREMQIQTTVKYCFIPVRVAKIKIVTSPNISKGVKKLDPSCTIWGI